MALSLSSLDRWLVAAELISQPQLDQLEVEAPLQGLMLAATLVERSLVGEEELVALVSDRLGIPPAPTRLYKQSVPSRVLLSVPEDLCWQFHLFPFAVDRELGRMRVAMSDPTDVEAVEALATHLGHQPELFVVGPRQLEKAIRKHYLDSWVDETGHQDRKRFFGYENITNPGVGPKRRDTPSEPASTIPRASANLDPAEPTPTHDEAMAPEPALGRDAAAALDDELDPPTRKRNSANHPAQPARSKQVARPPSDRGYPIDAPVNRGSPAPPQKEGASMPLARIRMADDRKALLRHRVEALEAALLELLEAVANSEDTHLGEIAERIHARLRSS